MVRIMADQSDAPRAKRQKTEQMETDPRSNPYLAHMYDKDSYQSSPLAKLKRHKTTMEQARKAEDGDANPFNGAPLSSEYFKILKARRDLPVHAQRFVYLRLLCES